LISLPADFRSSANNTILPRLTLTWQFRVLHRLIESSALKGSDCARTRIIREIRLFEPTHCLACSCACRMNNRNLISVVTPYSNASCACRMNRCILISGPNSTIKTAIAGGQPTGRPCRAGSTAARPAGLSLYSMSFLLLAFATCQDSAVIQRHVRACNSIHFVWSQCDESRGRLYDRRGRSRSARLKCSVQRCRSRCKRP
jgi:hypothetical protein